MDFPTLETFLRHFWGMGDPSKFYHWILFKSLYKMPRNFEGSPHNFMTTFFEIGSRDMPINFRISLQDSNRGIGTARAIQITDWRSVRLKTHVSEQKLEPDFGQIMSLFIRKLLVLCQPAAGAKILTFLSTFIEFSFKFPSDFDFREVKQFSI